MCPISKPMKTYVLEDRMLQETISYLFGSKNLPQHFEECFAQFLKMEMENNFNVFLVLSKLNRNFQIFMSKYPSLCYGDKAVTFFGGILRCYSDYHRY